MSEKYTQDITYRITYIMFSLLAVIIEQVAINKIKSLKSWQGKNRNILSVSITILK